MKTFSVRVRLYLFFIVLISNFTGCTTERTGIRTRRQTYLAHQVPAVKLANPPANTASNSPAVTSDPYWETPVFPEQKQVEKHHHESIAKEPEQVSNGSSKSNTIHQAPVEHSSKKITPAPVDNNSVLHSPEKIKVVLPEHSTPIPNVIKEEMVTAPPVKPEESQTEPGMKSGHTLPEETLTKEAPPETIWSKPIERKQRAEGMPPAPPVELTPDSTSFIDRMWTVGWKKNLKPKSANTTTSKQSTEKPATDSQDKSSTTSSKKNFLSLLSPTKPETANKPQTEVSQSAKVHGYFPPPGNFPMTQSEADIADYPRTAQGPVTLIKPEFLYADNFVEEDELETEENHQEKSKTYFPPQKTGFRDFPDFPAWR